MYISISFGRCGEYVPGHGATVSPATEWILGRAGVTFACEQRSQSRKSKGQDQLGRLGVISPYAQPLLVRLMLDPLAVGTLLALVMADQVSPALGFQAVGEVSGSEPAPAASTARRPSSR